MTAGDVYRALWRHKLLIVGLTVACVGATWYASSRQARTYEASALVRIQQRAYSGSEALPALQAAQAVVQTYAKIIDSDALDSRIRPLVSRQISPEDVSSVTLSGNPVDDLELLWISARSKDPARAKIVANAAPVALRRFIEDTGTFGDRVVTVKPATTPSSPVAPRTGWNVGIALVLGLVFNSALALLIEAFRDRLPEPEELGQDVGYPILATIPTLRLRRLTAVEDAMAEVSIVEEPAEAARAIEDDRGGRT